MDKLVFGILFRKDIIVDLPHTFNAETMYSFINTVIDEQCDAKCSKITFNFAKCTFIEPVGVVVLSNLIEYFKKIKVSIIFTGHTSITSSNKFLDDSGFFNHYLGKFVFDNHSLRNTTIPLELVASKDATSFLYFKLMPWIGREVGLSEDSLSAIRTSIEEIFHNIRDHSGVGIGCVFAQHYPRKNEIELAISDFGLGIPEQVKTAIPNLSDAEALRKASEEGFTTKSNVRNRGAGLTNIMRYITQRNNGRVVIISGRAQLSAVKGTKAVSKITARAVDGFYPGALVRCTLRTDTFESIIEDAELEVFEW